MRSAAARHVRPFFLTHRTDRECASVQGHTYVCAQAHSQSHRHISTPFGVLGRVEPLLGITVAAALYVFLHSFIRCNRLRLNIGGAQCSLCVSHPSTLLLHASYLKIVLVSSSALSAYTYLKLLLLHEALQLARAVRLAAHALVRVARHEQLQLAAPVLLQIVRICCHHCTVL